MYKVHAVWHSREYGSMAKIGSVAFQGWGVVVLCANGGDVGVGAVVMNAQVVPRVCHGSCATEVFRVALRGAVVRCFRQCACADEVLRSKVFHVFCYYFKILRCKVYSPKLSPPGDRAAGAFTLPSPFLVSCLYLACKISCILPARYITLCSHIPSCRRAYLHCSMPVSSAEQRPRLFINRVK